jgi:hypothetical protein
MKDANNRSYRYCGRDFSRAELEKIRQIIASDERPNRAKISQLWNELIERYHYLGHKPLPGAQLRYFVYSGSRLLATLGFGASAWSVAGRDRFIGWTAKQHKSNLHLIVNNARFLILLSVHPQVSNRSQVISRICRFG